MAERPGDWSLRKVGLEDLEDILLLRRELGRELGLFTEANTRPWEEAARRHLMASLPAGRFHVWLAFMHGEPVASSGLVPFERPPAPNDLSGLEGYVLNMYTRPAWRGRGLSRALLTELMAFARQQGMKKLWLHASEAGRPLYERMGFAPEPTALEWRVPPE